MSSTISDFELGQLSVASDPHSADQAVAEHTVDKPQKRGWTLLIVLGLVGTITLTVLSAGYSWCAYRWQHTVIDDARVKGRVYKIGARLDGQVRTVEVEPGERVVKDQVLVRLEDAHFVATMREAQAQVQSASKRLEIEKLAIEQARRQLALEIEHSKGTCQASAGDLEAATSMRDKWEREFKRSTTLSKSGVATGVEMDNAVSQRDNARALVKAAQGRHDEAEAACRLAQLQLEGLRVREAGLDVLAAEVDLARQRLARCETDIAATVMRAPADGWVIEHIVEPGGSAKVGEPMMSLWLGSPWIEAWVDERKITRIKIGSPVDITLPAFPNRKLRGSVEAIGVLADKELQTGPVPSTLHALFVRNAMVPVRIAVPEGPIRLQPGLTALVGINNGGPGNRGDGFLKMFSFLTSDPAPALQKQQHSKPN